MTLDTVPRAAADDEIDLRRLAATLWRRRALIAAVTVLCVALAGVYSLVVPKMYESQVMIQVSDQSGPAYATPAAAAGVIANLSFLADVGVRAGVADTPRELRRRVVAEPVRDTPFVRVRVRARTPEGAQRLARAAADIFLAAASEQIRGRRQTIEQRLAAVNAQLEDISRVLALTRQTLAHLQDRRPLPGQDEGFMRAFTLNAMGVSESLYSSLMAAQKDLTLELLVLRPPMLVEAPTLPETATTPRPALYLTLAFVLSLVAGVTGVLVRESLTPAVRLTSSPQV